MLAILFMALIGMAVTVVGTPVVLFYLMLETCKERSSGSFDEGSGPPSQSAIFAGAESVPPSAPAFFRV